MPPLDADDLAELLDLYALPARAASKLHADSGGNPYLALALGGAFADRTSAAWRPAPLPQRIHALLRDRVGALPVEVRETLLIAALATRPTVELLLRAGRAEAEHDIRLAAAAGLLVTDGSVVRFTPPAVATVVAELTTAAHRSTRPHRTVHCGHRRGRAGPAPGAGLGRPGRRGGPVDRDRGRGRAPPRRPRAGRRAVPAGGRPHPARAGRRAPGVAGRRGRGRRRRRAGPRS